MRKLSNTAATKEYVPNTLGNLLIFFCLTSILNTKTKCVLVAITTTGFLIAKGCSKIIIKMYLLELLQFVKFFPLL